MLDVTRTTTALLDGLRDPGDNLTWSQFDARYRPIILGFARHLGLRQHDAADVAQEALLQFLREYRQGRYQRSRGRLRSWLISIVHTKAAALRRQQAHRRESRGESAMLTLHDEQQLASIWDAQQRAATLREALDLLGTQTRTDPRTIRAFELLTVRAMPAASVAEALGMTTQDVYLAKSRVAQRLRSILEQLQAAYEEDL